MLRINRSYKWCLCVLLVVMTAAAYWHVMDCGFTNYDDDAYVTNNAHVNTGLNAENVKWAFVTLNYHLWHPLTWVSLMLDAQISGMDASGYHATNLLLHLANVVILFLLLNAMTGALWRSAFVAAIFAIYPINVESVAWIPERKNVLSTLLWLLGIWAYVRYVRKPGVWRYLQIVAVLILGLMAKPTLAPFPVLLLALDYWPLGRFMEGKRSERLAKARKLVMEKLPFVALAIVALAITMLVQENAHEGTINEFPLGVRLANTAATFVNYLGKMIWPDRLAIYYPYPGTSLPVVDVLGSALILFLLSAATVKAARSYPYALVGWVWFVAVLLPVVGLVQFGTQRMADRYAYVSFIGLYIILAWGIPDLLNKVIGKVDNGRARRRGAALAACATLVTVLLIACTCRQVGYWRDNVTLFTHALEVTSNNSLAHYNLACELIREGDTEGAMAHVREAVRIAPDFGDAQNSLACGLVQQGKTDEAILHFRLALRANPEDVFVHDNLGAALLDKGKYR